LATAPVGVLSSYAKVRPRMIPRSTANAEAGIGVHHCVSNLTRLLTATSTERTIVLDDVVDLNDIDLINDGVFTGLAAKPGRETQVENSLLAPHAHMTCWRKAQTPARLHYGANPRVPPLLCLAANGWSIATRHALERPDREAHKGEHGYDNDDPDMRALFVAHGPAFRRGLLVPEFDNVDVYPLLAKILGIRPAPNDGDFNAVAPMLASPAH